MSNQDYFQSSSQNIKPLPIIMDSLGINQIFLPQSEKRHERKVTNMKELTLFRKELEINKKTKLNRLDEQINESEHKINLHTHQVNLHTHQVNLLKNKIEQCEEIIDLQKLSIDREMDKIKQKNIQIIEENNFSITDALKRAVLESGITIPLNYFDETIESSISSEKVQLPKSKRIRKSEKQDVGKLIVEKYDKLKKAGQKPSIIKLAKQSNVSKRFVYGILKQSGLKVGRVVASDVAASE